MRYDECRDVFRGCLYILAAGRLLLTKLADDFTADFGREKRRHVSAELTDLFDHA